MKGLAVDQLVFEVMFPKPKATDPQNFQGLLQRQLVPEVRLETQAFYGHLASQEAKYPGLDYAHPPHRVRLARYPWHRRLFRAFDHLGLTPSEIATLTKWEGTRWAKERFEREQGIVIRDTTADGIRDWVPPERRRPGPPPAQHADVELMDEVPDDEEAEEDHAAAPDEMDADDAAAAAAAADAATDDSEAELQSVGADLNERLRAAAAQRAAGHDAVVMDEEWEQWLKETVEAGGIPFLAASLAPDANIPGTRPAFDNPHLPASILHAARRGQWDQIPDYLHTYIRREMEAAHRRMEDAQLGSSAAAAAASPPAGPPTASAPASPARAGPPAALGRPVHGPPDLPGPGGGRRGSPRPRPAGPVTARLQSRFSEQVSRRGVRAGATAVAAHYLTRDPPPRSHS